MGMSYPVDNLDVAACYSLPYRAICAAFARMLPSWTVGMHQRALILLRASRQQEQPRAALDAVVTAEIDGCDQILGEQ